MALWIWASIPSTAVSVGTEAKTQVQPAGRWVSQPQHMDNVRGRFLDVCMLSSTLAHNDLPVATPHKVSRIRPRLVF